MSPLCKNYKLKIMRKLFFMFVLALACTMPMAAQVQQIVGEWITVDDKTGEQLSVVKIFKATDGLYYGKIVKLLKGNPDEKCVACTGADKDKPVVGLIIIRGFQEKDGKLVSGDKGRVLDPDNGKFYYGKIWLEDGKLILRGSLDKKGILGRSQTWIRKK